MTKTCLALALAAVCGAASAHETTYRITTTWFEPQTQPKNSVFEGTFTFDEDTLSVTGMTGMLSESMTGGSDPAATTWLTLAHQLVTQRDDALGGTFVGVFRNANTNTFTTLFGGDGWSPQAGVAVGGVYYGFPAPASNPGNAYAYVFIPDDPTAPLTAAQLAKVAYADCAPGGMMQAACMTGTSLAGYGAVGTMDGYPLSQTITAVPEPAGWAMGLAGLGVLGSLARRRRREA